MVGSSERGTASTVLRHMRQRLLAIAREKRWRTCISAYFFVHMLGNRYWKYMTWNISRTRTQ